MGKRYQRRAGARRYRDYTDEDLERTILDVREGMALRKAEEKYNIPHATIARKMKGQHSKEVGRPTVFTRETEDVIVEAISLCSKWGFPITAFDLQLIVKNYLDRKGVVEPRFKNNVPGRFWVEGFLERNKNIISQRFIDNIKRARAAVTPDTINNYFESLSTTLEGVKPEAIINFDETNMTDDPGKRKVLTRRNFKNPKNIADSSKSSISVMFAGSASGVLLPPYVVYRSEHLYDTWTQNGPEKTYYNRTKRGWFDTKTFEDWFFKLIVPYCEDLEDGPKVILGDNLASHLSIKVIQKCEELNIRFTYLPANSTHICQPLDVAFFRPLKGMWRKILMEWKQKNRGTIPKDQFPKLLKKCLTELKEKTPENLISGFRSSGIYPLNKNKILEKIPTIKEPEDEANKQDWANAFEVFLKESRLSETTPRRQMKKRLQVPPGQAVTASDLIQTSGTTNIEQINMESDIETNVNDIDELTISDDPLRVEEATTSQRDQRKANYSSSTASTESCDINDNLSDHDSIHTAVHNTSDGWIITSTENPHQYDFVKVSLTYNENTKKACEKIFIAQIIDCADQNKFTCKFLRNQGSKQKGVFVFPPSDDIMVIRHDQIKSVVNPIQVKRGRYMFGG